MAAITALEITMKKVKLIALALCVMGLGTTVMGVAGDKPITATLLPAPVAVDQQFCPACMPPCPGVNCPVLK